jgi:hypothetical protein
MVIVFTPTGPVSFPTQEAAEEATKAPLIKEIERIRRGGRGGGRAPTVTTPQTFESSLLRQSFASRAALEAAESSFRQQQIQQRDIQRAEVAAERAARIEAETRPGFLTRFAGGTLGAIQEQDRQREIGGLVSGFETLTPEEASKKALAGERGFGLEERPEGQVITFDVGEFEPEIRQAGRKAFREAGFTPLDIVAPGTTGGLGGFGLDIARLGREKAVRKQAIKTRSEILGAGRFGLGVAEITAELGKTVLTGGQIREGEVFPKGLKQVSIFDRGIARRIKEQPSDIIQLGTEVRLAGAGIAAGAVTSPLALETGLPLGRRVVATAQELLTPIRIKPGTFVPVGRQGIAADIKVVERPDVTFFRGVGKARGEDIELATFGRTFGDDITVQFTGTRRPFIEVGRGGRVETGVIETISGAPTKRVGAEFPSRARIGTTPTGDIIADLPQTARVRDITTGEISLAGRRLLKRVEAPTGVREEFFFGAGRPDITFTKARVSKVPEFRDIVGFGGRRGRIKTKVEIDPFFAEVSGRLDVARPTFDVDRGITRISGRGRRPSTIQKQISQDIAGGLAQNIRQISKSFVQPKITPDTSPGLVGATVFDVLKTRPSQFAGTGQFERTDFVSFAKPDTTVTNLLGGQTLAPTRQQISFVPLSVGVREKPETQQVSKIFSDLAVPRGAVTPAVVPSITVPTVTSTVTELQAEDLISRRPTVRPRPDFFGFDFKTPPPTRFGFAFPPPPFGFPGFRLPRARKGKRRLRRTPSLISIELGIEAPRISPGEVTGLIARPIIKKKKRRKR